MSADAAGAGPGLAPAMGPVMGFAGNTLRRDTEVRDADSLVRALDDGRAHFHLFAGEPGAPVKALVDAEASPAATFTARKARGLKADLDAAVLLGHDGEGAPRLAARITLGEDGLAGSLKALDLRSLLYSGAVSEEEAGAVAQAASLLHWHADNRFCGRCGSASAATLAGARRDCPGCGGQIFPRTDPVVIMLAVSGDGERVLLGRGAHFPPGWFSTLAGFVEAGETIEDAVRRETAEESGVRLGAVRYMASQPWPFPHSLMIGCEGVAEEESVEFDRRELEDCRWFAREEVAAMLAGTHPDGLRCPPEKAIAHHLIRGWVERAPD